MPLPYDLAVLCHPGLAPPAADAALRKLGNRMPLVLAGEVPVAELREAAAALGAPVGLLWGRETWGPCGFAPEGWRRAARAARTTAARMVVLSRAPEPELLAAAGAGAAPAWLRPRGTAAPAGFVPVHAAASLAALVAGILAAEEPHVWVDSWQDPAYPRPYLQGIRLFNARRYFDAHEVWEEEWQAEKAAGGDFYRGLIQIAAAALHWERGNSAGARSLHRSGRSLLLPFAPRHLGLDLDEFLLQVDAWFAPLEAALETGRDPPAPDAARAPRIALSGR